MSDPHVFSWHVIPYPAVIIDASGYVLDVNAAAEYFFNKSTTMLKKHTFFEHCGLSEVDHTAMASALLKGGTLFVSDCILSTAPRVDKIVHISLAPLDPQNSLSDAAQQFIVVLAPRDQGLGSDVTVSKDNTLHSTIGMAQMLAHEVKNPLAGITGAAQLLAMDLSKSEDRELTDLIVHETRRIAQLLAQVEQFGDVRPAALSPVNVHDILDRARRSAQVGFATHVAMIEEFDPSLPDVLVDADQVQQVFLNLLKNAAEAIPQTGGRVRLRSYYDHGFRKLMPSGERRSLPVTVEVIDDGPGISDELQQRLFEPFVSGRENGTGLGLALVQKMITQNNAAITFYSKPGETVFRLSFPKA